MALAIETLFFIPPETGMLFQGGALFDSMNIEENVMFPLRMFSNKEKSEMILRVNEVLERVDLKNINKKFLLLIYLEAKVHHLQYQYLE